MNIILTCVNSRNRYHFLSFALSKGQRILSDSKIVKRSLNSSDLFNKSPPPLRLNIENSIDKNFNQNDDLEPSKDHLEKIYESTNSIQRSIQSRRTISLFETKNDGTEHDDILNKKIKEAVYRAIQCAMTAPNHKRTEPFTFIILSSVKSKEELSEICYNVTYRNEMKKNDNNDIKTQNEKDLLTMKQRIKIAKSKALKKMEKWKNEVPMYLAVVVGGQPNQIPTKDNVASENYDLYEILDLIPPVSIRQLEDVSYYYNLKC